MFRLFTMTKVNQTKYLGLRKNQHVSASVAPLIESITQTFIVQ